MSKSATSKFLSMKRGLPARAERDVIARDLEKYSDKIKQPYALATYMAQRGAKSRKRAKVAKEFAQQKKAAKRSRKKKSRK